MGPAAEKSAQQVRVLCVGGVDITFHRLGREAWSPGAVLRSWAVAPWQTQGHSVAVACLPGEVVWLGLSSDPSHPATVVLTAVQNSAARELNVPPDWQLGWLLDGAGHPTPQALGDERSAAYRVDLRRQGQVGAVLDIDLLSPAAWAEQFEPLSLEPAEVPPPVPRYSRIVRPNTRPSRAQR